MPLFNTIRPYLAASVALAATLALIAANYITDIELLWVTVSWAALTIAVLVMIGQTVRTEKEIKNYTTQLIASKERLSNEIKQRFWAEKTISENKVRLQFIDENIPVMLAYFNMDQRCRYHNRIFRRWFGLKPDQIDGQLLQEFSNEAFFSGIQNCIEGARTGKAIHNERLLKSTKGFPYVFTEQFIPHLDVRGKVIGFYTLHTPRAQDKNRPSSKINPTNSVLKSEKPETNNSPEIEVTPSENQSSQASQPGITAARITQAIEGGEFHLFCQKIVPVKTDSGSATHHEVLIRMAEEENNLIPPGAFLPFVEKYRMMPRLDRWVVEYIAQWLSTHEVPPESIFCINVAKDTLSDTDFPEFIHNQLQTTNIPATKLCFEIEEMDAELDPTNALVFAEKVRQLGCLVSLCSFSHSRTSLDFLKKIKIDFLKIDGSLVCNILRDQEDLEKVTAINKIAQAMTVQTIAELVETDEIIAKLSEIGVDFAQGFGIARPHPLKDLE